MSKKYKDFMRIDLGFVPSERFFYFNRWELNRLSQMLNYISSEYLDLRFINNDDAFEDKTKYKLNEDLENMISQIIEDNHGNRITICDTDVRKHHLVAESQLTEDMFELRCSLLRVYVSVYYIIRSNSIDDDLDKAYEDCIVKHVFENSVVRNTMYNRIIKIINKDPGNSYKNINLRRFKKFYFNSSNFTKIVASAATFDRSFTVVYSEYERRFINTYLDNTIKIDKVKDYKSTDSRVHRQFKILLHNILEDKRISIEKFDKFRHEIYQAFYKLFPDSKDRWCLNEVLAYIGKRPSYECEYLVNKYSKIDKYKSDEELVVYHGITMNKRKYSSLEDYLDAHKGYKSLTENIDVANDFSVRGEVSKFDPIILEVKLKPSSKYLSIYKLLDDLYKQDPTSYYKLYRNFFYEKEILADLNDHEYSIMSDHQIKQMINVYEE